MYIIKSLVTFFRVSHRSLRPVQYTDRPSSHARPFHSIPFLLSAHHNTNMLHSHLPLHLLRLPLRLSRHLLRFPLSLARHLVRFSFGLPGHFFRGALGLFGVEADGGFEGFGGLFCEKGGVGG